MPILLLFLLTRTTPSIEPKPGMTRKQHQQGVETQWKQCGSPTSVASQYLSSFYFIIYTMMTVGYGDQSANPSDKKARHMEWYSTESAVTHVLPMRFSFGIGGYQCAVP